VVIWLIGLSGSGKSTLGREIAAQWRTRQANVVQVDGDEVRRIFGQDRSPSDYSPAGRRQNAERVAELCAWLDAQGLHVVCSILSIFPDLREASARRYSGYFEVYLNPPFETLVSRDTKGLYRKALAGELSNMVGVDIPFPAPKYPHMTIDTSQPEPVADCASRVLTRALAIS